MPVRLSTTVSKINLVPNPVNRDLLKDFNVYMKKNGASESHQNNCLKTIMAFDKFIGPDITFFDIKKMQQIITFLDTKVKTKDEDPDKKWITTWNDYLGDIKFFFRWLHNQRIRNIGEPEAEAKDNKATYSKLCSIIN